MKIKGLQKTTLLDFPEKVACTVFTGGCNFRCSFCHNASLVLAPTEVNDISEEEFFRFLEKRRGILDGVCVTGGEPLLQHDILPFFERIHSLGLSVKLDTNGWFYDKLSNIISLGLVDYIAMDIKNTREKYAMTAGIPSVSEDVFKSIKLIMECGVPYEFRTTVVRELHTVDDIRDIARSISGASQYYLQCFKDSGDLIGQNYSAHTEDTMRSMLEAIRPFVGKCALRGI